MRHGPPDPAPQLNPVAGFRVLIVKTSSMGDVVHAMPAVTDIAGQRPGALIDWLVEKSFAAMPARHINVRRVIPLQWRAWRKSLHRAETRHALSRCLADLRATRYDLVIDMQGLLKSAAFAAMAHGPRAGLDWASAREPLASLTYAHRVSVPVRMHAVERCRHLAAKALGYPLPATPPDFGLTSESNAWRPGPGPFAALIPCASRAEKLWPQMHWVEIGQALVRRGLAVMVLWGSPDEHARAREIAQAVGGATPPFMTVAQVIDALSQASLVVGLDTGMTHIAAACGITTVGVYCDHDPGLAGVTGAGRVASLGGVGQRPTVAAVLQALDDLDRPQQV